MLTPLVREMPLELSTALNGIPSTKPAVRQAYKYFDFNMAFTSL
jgi:hypothetical protein